MGTDPRLKAVISEAAQAGAEGICGPDYSDNKVLDLVREVTGIVFTDDSGLARVAIVAYDRAWLTDAAQGEDAGYKCAKTWGLID